MYEARDEGLTFPQVRAVAVAFSQVRACQELEAVIYITVLCMSRFGMVKTDLLV